MMYTITCQCIECDRCLTACPTQAIQQESDHYWIDPKSCTNCRGYYRVPQCWAVCPTNGGCVTVDETTLSKSEPSDYWESWFTTYNQVLTRLKTTKNPSYWENWFTLYSEQVARIIHSESVH